MIRIAIDIQALQTEGSKDRGRGQYLLHLVRKVWSWTKNDYILVVNANLTLPELAGLAAPSHRQISRPFGPSQVFAKVCNVGTGVDPFYRSLMVDKHNGKRTEREIRD